MSDHTAQRGTEPAVRVSTLELFFDLVFVFTATQLTKYLADDISAERMLRVILMFGVIWWMYDGRFGRSASATFGLSLAYLLWWAYFSDDTAAEHAFADTPPQRRAMVAIYAFGYAHLVLLLGIVVIAAGVKKAIGQRSPRCRSACGWPACSWSCWSPRCSARSPRRPAAVPPA